MMRFQWFILPAVLAALANVGMACPVYIHSGGSDTAGRMDRSAGSYQLETVNLQHAAVMQPVLSASDAPMSVAIPLPAAMASGILTISLIGLARYARRRRS